MSKRNYEVPRRALVATAAVIAATLSAVPAHASGVFMFVATGSAVTAYGTTGTGSIGNTSLYTLAAPNDAIFGGSWGNAFSVATFGTGTTQFVIVGDPGNHALAEYSYTSTGTTAGTASFIGDWQIPQDSIVGISPQEIAIDPKGNLWTTSANGVIAEYCGSTGNCTIGNGTATVSASPRQLLQSLSIASADGLPRGIMIDTSTSSSSPTIFVTTESYGSNPNGNVFQFTLAAGDGKAGGVTEYSALAGSTVGTGTNATATGQLRGITYDAHGDIFWADSSWNATQGYVNENSTPTTVLSGLGGPNQLVVARGAGTGVLASTCDVLYIAGYYSQNIEEVSTGYTTSGTTTGCGGGTFGGTTANFFTSALSTPITGIAFTGAQLALGGNSSDVGPEGLFVDVSIDAPEPATWFLVLFSAFAVGGLKVLAERYSRAQAK